MLQWFLALFIFDCANGIQRRQYQAQQQREEGKRSASDDWENFTKHTECCNDNTPSYATLRFFRIFAILYANNVCDQLGNRAGQQYDAGNIQHCIAKAKCDYGSNSAKGDNREKYGDRTSNHH